MQKVCQDEQPESHDCLSDLEWVLSYYTTNPTTTDMAELILDSEEEEPTLPKWPGHITDAEETAVLLGTPQGAGVAWLLINHSFQFGRKYVDKIHIFGSGSGKLCLAFHIAPAPAPSK